MNTFDRETNTIYKLTYQDGTQLETTWNHPFYIQDKGFVEAISLVVGDLSVTMNIIKELLSQENPFYHLTENEIRLEYDKNYERKRITYKRIKND